MASNESAVLFDQPGPKGRKTIRIVNRIAGIIFPSTTLFRSGA